MSSGTPNSSFVRIIGTSGVEGRGEGQFAQPRGVAIDTKTKEIFVCDCNNHRVCVYNSQTLKFVRYIGRGVQGTSFGCLNYAVGLCLDGNNHLYVADTNNHRIAVFNQTTGAHIQNIGGQGSGEPGLLNSPYGVCVDRASGSLFVADYENHRVQVFNRETGVFERIIGLGLGSNPGQLNQPIVLCIDDDNGNLLVADYCNNRVQVFNKDTGNFIRQIGGHGIPGVSQSFFVGPRGLCVDSKSGLLFVADRENHRIQLYNKNTFAFIRHIGSGPGVGPGMFNRPMEMCVNKDDGTLLVVDGYNHRVQILGVPELQVDRLRSAGDAARRARLEQEDRFKPRPSSLAVCADVRAHSTICADKRIVRFASLESPCYDIRLPAEELLSLSLLASPSSSGAVIQAPAPPVVYGAASAPLDAQATLFMSLICDTGTAGHGLSLLVPSVLALRCLLDRHWHPGTTTSAPFLTLLLDLLFNVGGCTTSEDEKCRVVDTCLHILALAIDHSEANRDLLLERILAELHCGNTEKGPVRDTGDADALALMLSFILLAHILSDCWHAIPATELSYLPDEQVGALHSYRRDINGLIYGSSFLSAFNRMQAVAGVTNPQRIQGSPAAIIAAASVFSKCYQQDDDSGTLRGLLQLLQATYEVNKLRSSSADDSALEKAQLTLLGVAHTFINRSQELFQPLPLGSEAYTRGGRNIWRADEPLQVGDLVDAMDRERSWFESYIVGISNGIVRVHFMGWGSKWDDDVLDSEVAIRIAPLNTKTRNWRSDLFEGGLIEIKCNDDTVNQKWMWGKISLLNIADAWVEVSYSFAHEPAIIKGADLHGETICPVGMHTKDKSKHAAAAIIKPVRTVEDVNSAGMNEFDSSHFSHCTDDAYFDSSDSSPLHAACSESGVGLRMLPVQDVAGPLRRRALYGVPSLAAAISYVSVSTFESLMREVCYAVTHAEGETATWAEGLAVVRALCRGPHRKLVCPYFCRVLLVQAGMRAKIVVAGHLLLRGQRLEVLMRDPSAATQLLEKVSALEGGYASLLLRALGDSLPLSVVRYITERLHATVSKCAMLAASEASVGGSETSRSLDESMATLASHVFSDLLASERFSPTAAAARGMLRHLLLAASTAAAERLKQSWIDTIKAYALRACSSYTHSLARDDGTSTLNSLVLLLDKARSVSRLECLQTTICPMSAEIAFMSLFAELPLELRITLSKFLALALSSLLDTNKNELSLGTRTARREALISLVKALVVDATSLEFSNFYEVLLSRRLVRGRYCSLSFESSVLNELPPMMNASKMLRDIGLADRYTQEFRRYVMRGVDSNEIPFDDSASLVVAPGAVKMTVLSSSHWPSQTVSPVHYSSLRIPGILQDIGALFCRFFASFDVAPAGDTQRRLHWCHSLGTVTMSCKIYTGAKVLVSVGEHQCAVLMAVDFICSKGAADASLLAVGEQTNLAIEQVVEIVSSLCGGTMPLMERQGDRVSLSRSLLCGELGGEDGSNLIVAPSILGAASAYEVSQREWRACAMEAFVVRRLKKVAADRSGCLRTDYGLVMTAMSFEDILQAINSDMELVFPSTPEEAGECCSRLASMGVLELIKGVGGVLETARGYSYLPVTGDAPPQQVTAVGCPPAKALVAESGGASDQLRGERIFETFVAALGIPCADIGDVAIKASDFVDLASQWASSIANQPPQPSFLRRSISLFESATQPALPRADISLSDSETRAISSRVVDTFAYSLAQLSRLCARHAEYLEGPQGASASVFAAQQAHIDRVAKALNKIVASAPKADAIGILRTTVTSLNPQLLDRLISSYEAVVCYHEGSSALADSIYDRIDEHWSCRRAVQRAVLSKGLQLLPLSTDIMRELADGGSNPRGRSRPAARQAQEIEAMEVEVETATSSDSSTVFITLEDFIRAVVKVSYDFTVDAAWTGDHPGPVSSHDAKAEIAHLRLRHKQRSGDLQHRAMLRPSPLHATAQQQQSTLPYQLQRSRMPLHVEALNPPPSPSRDRNSDSRRHQQHSSFNESKCDSNCNVDVAEAFEAIFSSKISAAQPLGKMMSAHARRLHDICALFFCAEGVSGSDPSTVLSSATPHGNPLRRRREDYFTRQETGAVTLRLLDSASLLLVEADLWAGASDDSYRGALLGASSFSGAVRRVFDLLDTTLDGQLTVGDFDDFYKIEPYPLETIASPGAAAAANAFAGAQGSSSWQLLSGAHLSAARTQGLWGGILGHLERDLHLVIARVTEAVPDMASEKTHHLLQMLSMYRWDVNALVVDYSENARRVRRECCVYPTFQCRALQIVPRRGTRNSTSAVGSLDALCGGCAAMYSASYIYSLHCRHGFCLDCWVLYVEDAPVADGDGGAVQVCLSCPSPGCSCPIGLDFIEFLHGGIPALHAEQELQRRSKEYASYRLSGLQGAPGEAAAFSAKWRGYLAALEPYAEGSNQLCTHCLRAYHWPAPCASWEDSAASVASADTHGPSSSPYIQGFQSFYEDVATFRRMLSTASSGSYGSAEGLLPQHSTVLDNLADCLWCERHCRDMVLHAQTSEQLYSLVAAADSWRLLSQAYSVTANLQAHLCRDGGAVAGMLRLRLLLVALAASSACLHSEVKQWPSVAPLGGDRQSLSKVHMYTANTKRVLFRLLDSWICHIESNTPDRGTAETAATPRTTLYSPSGRPHDRLLLHVISQSMSSAQSPFHARAGGTGRRTPRMAGEVSFDEL